MPRNIVTISPSSAFIDINIGDVVEIQGKKYCILQRDPWVVHATRYYWFDYILGRLYQRSHYEDKDHTPQS